MTRWPAFRRLLISYHIPPGDTPENFAAQVLADVLSTGQSSRFYQHLVKDKQLAVSIDSDAGRADRPQPLYITATPRPGVKPEDLEKAIYEEIEAVQKDGVTTPGD